MPSNRGDVDFNSAKINEKLLKLLIFNFSLNFFPISGKNLAGDDGEIFGCKYFSDFWKETYTKYIVSNYCIFLNVFP